MTAAEHTRTLGRRDIVLFTVSAILLLETLAGSASIGPSAIFWWLFLGLIFFVPNRNETVRVNGTARVVRDLELREVMAIRGRVPELAVVVSVEEAFYHCGKAIIRAGLWSPEEAVSTEGLPTYAEANVDHTGRDFPLEQVTKWFDDNDKYRLYDD